MSNHSKELNDDMFIIPNDAPVVLLKCMEAFNSLTEREKNYAHNLCQAAHFGSLICLFQTSPESPGIFLMLYKIFKIESIDELKCKCLKNGLSEDDFQAILVYSAAFFSNSGNYKSFGDTKIIPAVDIDKLEKFIKSTKAFEIETDKMMKIWNCIKNDIKSVTKKTQQLGFDEHGISTYYSNNCTENDAKIVQEYLDAKSISPYNTRLFKNENGLFEIRIAGSKISESEVTEFTTKNGTKFKFKSVVGDYSEILKIVCNFMNDAKMYTANNLETDMLIEYCNSFTNGSIDSHKNASRLWIKNKSPIIESYIGFIESYRDPIGVRGEFEGFVSMVNKELSKKFQELVVKAEVHFIPLLPWPIEFEKNTFQQPDFTSLDVLAFGSSGIPAGINIPNYDDIRQNDGFKNVSLGNVLTSGYKDTKITFLSEKDKELYSLLKLESFEVQVGLHELLGHGSGKLFEKTEDGKYNFDYENTVNPETGEKISSWYEPNETWDSKFKTISSPYEECRAECVGLYLCLSAEALKIFGHVGSKADDIIYINWLNMVRAGLLALEFYNPENRQWRQAHMQARFVILRVLIEAGNDLITIERVVGHDNEPDIILCLNRSKINDIGKPAIGSFLRKLQVYKSTADYENGKKMFDHYSSVNDDLPFRLASLREIVLNRKQPRKMFVQCNTIIKNGSVLLKEYDPSCIGLILSVCERFPSSIEEIIFNLMIKDEKYFK